MRARRALHALVQPLLAVKVSIQHRRALEKKDRRQKKRVWMIFSSLLTLRHLLSILANHLPRIEIETEGRPWKMKRSEHSSAAFSSLGVLRARSGAAPSQGMSRAKTFAASRAILPSSDGKMQSGILRARATYFSATTRPTGTKWKKRCARNAAVQPTLASAAGSPSSSLPKCE